MSMLNGKIPNSPVKGKLCQCEPVSQQGRCNPLPCLPLRGRWQPPIPREEADGRGSSVPHHQHPVPRISPIPTRALRPRRIGSHPLMAPALRPRLPRSPRANPHSPPSCVVGTAIGRPPARSAQSEALSLRACVAARTLQSAPLPPPPGGGGSRRSPARRLTEGARPFRTTNTLSRAFLRSPRVPSVPVA